jgi:hypothetical protein
MNLHPSFHTIYTSILTAKSEPSLSDVKGILIGSASSAIIIKSEPVDITLATQSSNKHDIPRKQSGQFSRTGTTPSSPPEDKKGFHWCDPTNEGHCHHCGHPGHIAAHCIYNMPQDVQDWVMNYPKGAHSPPPSTNPNHQ